MADSATSLSSDLHLDNYSLPVQDIYYTEQVKEITNGAEHEILWDIYVETYKNLSKQHNMQMFYSFKILKEIFLDNDFIKFIIWKDRSIIGFCILTNNPQKIQTHTEVPLNKGAIPSPSQSSPNNVFHIITICINPNECNQNSIYSLIGIISHFSKIKNVELMFHFSKNKHLLYPENIIYFIKECISIQQKDIYEASGVRVKKSSDIGLRYKSTVFDSLCLNLNQQISPLIFEKYCKGEIEGLENVANLDTGYILACNHVSYLDWLILYSIFKKTLNKEIRFLAKERLFKNIIWGRLMRAANCILVTDEHGINISSMREIYKIIKNKGIIGIFPEGTRSPTGELLKAKNGTAEIAYLTNSPIVPVGLIGFYETWPRHRLFPSFKKCKIKIGPPIYIDQSINFRHKEVFDYNITITMKHIGKLIDKEYTY